MAVSDSPSVTHLGLKSSILRRQSALCLEFLQEAQTACHAGHAVDRMFSRLFRKRKELGGRDRRLIQQVVFSVFRWQGWLHPWFLEKPRSAMLLAALLDQDPWNGLYENWASAEHWSILENGLIPLPTLSDKQKWIQEYTGEPLDLKNLVPSWFLHSSEGIKIADTPSMEKLIESMQTPPPIWIRLQTALPQRVYSELNQKQIPYIPSSLLQSLGFTRKVDLHTLETFKHGAFEIQDIASQCVGFVCNPQSGESWWDVCAGAGGKSLHLAALMENQGKVWATEIRPAMIAEIRGRARRGGWTCVKAKRWDGERLPTQCVGPFDGVLVDAPCSGTGTWRRNPDMRWRTFPKMIQEYAQVQQKILKSIQQHVKPGGKLVYATCSLTERENSDIIKEFLADYPHFQLEPFSHPITKAGIAGMLTIQPYEFNSNGMFIACLRRQTQ